MSTPRRRIVRPPLPAPQVTPDQQRRLNKLRQELEQEQASLARWQKRLRRAFHTVEKLHKVIDRITTRIALLEKS